MMLDNKEFIYDLMRSFPDHSNVSLIMYTTSSEEVSQIADMKYIIPKINDLVQETMVIALSHMVGESMSPELVEYGEKIYEICPCLRFQIAKTLLFLYKTEKTPEQWSKLAADKDNPVFMVGDEISELCKMKKEIQSFMDDEQDDPIIRLAAAMVDNLKHVDDIKMVVQPERYFCKMQIVSLFGMALAGIGKSTCAREIFKDESIDHFDQRVWVNIGPNYQAEEIFIYILAQIYPSIDKMLMKEEELARGLCAKLAYKRCLIVLDDLRSTEPLTYLKYAFPDMKSTTLVKTRLVGRKIVEKCEGGPPLLILTMADQMLKVEMSVEYWNNVASGKQKSGLHLRYLGLTCYV